MATTDGENGRRSIAVIGGGAAGVFTAHKLVALGLPFDITLFERGARVGGHTIGNDFAYDGSPMHVDCGAQFFFEGNEPDYCQLLDDLGYFSRDGEVIQVAAGINLHDATANRRMLHIPSRSSALLVAYLTQVRTLRRLKRFTEHAQEFYKNGDWTTPFGPWLDGLDVGGSARSQREFKAEIARPLMYQFGLVPPDQIDSLSARFVIYFYVTSVPQAGYRRRRGVDPVKSERLFKIYCLRRGMDGVLTDLVNRLIDDRRLDLRVNTRVTRLESADDQWRIHTSDGETKIVDEVVFATNPKRTLEILGDAPGLAPIPDLLGSMRYSIVPVSIQAGVYSYLPRKKRHWELSNVGFRRDANGRTTHCMLGIWFGAIHGGRTAAAFSKAWGSPELQPADAPTVGQQFHELMIGTPEFIAAREVLREELQGRRHLWFAGGYLREYDSQNASLRAAKDVVTRIAHAYSGKPIHTAPRLPELHEEGGELGPSPFFVGL